MFAHYCKRSPDRFRYGSILPNPGRAWDYVAERDFRGGCPCRARSAYGQRNQRERPRQSGKSELPHVRPLSVGECSSGLRALPRLAGIAHHVQCVASPQYLFEEIVDATQLLFHHFVDHAAAPAGVYERCLLLRAKSLAPNNRPPVPNRTRRPWRISGAGTGTVLVTKSQAFRWPQYSTVIGAASAA